MNRKNFLCMNRYALIVLAAAAISMAGCGGCTHQTPAGDGADSLSAGGDDGRNVFGICGEGSAMNTLQVITNGGDTLSLNISEAKDNGKVFGGYDCGDRMAVVLDEDRTAARIVINETTLDGHWVVVDPDDRSSFAGIRLKVGGIAHGIGENSVNYTSWRIVDGRLEITADTRHGSNKEEINVYDIVKLDADSLVYCNSDTVFRFVREQSAGVMSPPVRPMYDINK